MLESNSFINAVKIINCRVRILDKDIVEHAPRHALALNVEYAEARGHRVRQEQIIMRNGVLEACVQFVNS